MKSKPPSAPQSEDAGWVRLSGLTVTGVRLGAYPAEKDAPRSIRVDAGVWTNTVTPGHTDALDDALDYAKVAAMITDTCQSKHFNLLETLAERLAELLLQEFPVECVELEVYKPDVIGGATASVAITRRR